MGRSRGVIGVVERESVIVHQMRLERVASAGDTRNETQARSHERRLGEVRSVGRRGGRQQGTLDKRHRMIAYAHIRARLPASNAQQPFSSKLPRHRTTSHHLATEIIAIVVVRAA